VLTHFNMSVNLTFSVDRGWSMSRVLTTWCYSSMVAQLTKQF